MGLCITQRNCFRPVLLSFLLFASLVSQPAIPKDQETLAPINGTFVQLLAGSHGQWAEKDWRIFFGYLKKLKISQLFLQWTVAGNIAFFPSSTLQSVKAPPLETILKFADRFNVKINIGLVHDRSYWSQVGKKPDDVREYLTKLLERSSKAAEQLAPIARKYNSFHGWYITEEIDDVNWTTPVRRRLLFAYLKGLSEKLEKLTPDNQIAISGFSNSNIDVNEFSEFWDQLLKQTKINLALFQDGIGVNKLTLARLPTYLEAFKRVTTENKIEMGVIIEIFNQTNGYPLDNKPFRAIPADLNRVNRQREIAGKFSQNLIAFSIPEYMTPLAGDSGDVLYKQYLLDAEQREARNNSFGWFANVIEIFEEK